MTHLSPGFYKTFLLVLLMMFAGQTFAGNCSVTFYEHSGGGGHQIALNEADFPYGARITFEAAPNWFDRATNIIYEGLQGNFDTDDIFFVVGFATKIRRYKHLLNSAGQLVIGQNVGSYVYSLETKVDALGNIIGVDTGNWILSPGSLYDFVFGRSGWSNTD